MLRVPYTSCDDWTPCVDLVRCNPKFFGRPRFDCVIIDDGKDKPVGFGRLEALLSCKALGQWWDLAFITRTVIVHTSDEVSIGLAVVEEMRQGEFILVDRIMRAAHLVSTFEDVNPPRYFVNDLVDYDMFLRLDPTHVNGS